MNISIIITCIILGILWYDSIIALLSVMKCDTYNELSKMIYEYKNQTSNNILIVIILFIIRLPIVILSIIPISIKTFMLYIKES